MFLINRKIIRSLNPLSRKLSTFTKALNTSTVLLNPEQGQRISGGGGGEGGADEAYGKSPFLKFYIETYGCQMNVADSEIVSRLLIDDGHQQTDTCEDADLILTNTCAIRENAEAKIWHRLAYFRSLKVTLNLSIHKNYLLHFFQLINYYCTMIFCL